MCQSKANGGQRCYGHARKRLDTAISARDEAAKERDARLDEHGPAYFENEQWTGEWAVADQDYRDAQITLASTARGAQELRAQADSLDPASAERATIEWCLKRGAQVRERNAAVRAATRTAA